MIELRTMRDNKLEAKWNPQQKQIIIRDKRLNIDAAFTLREEDGSYEVEEIPLNNSKQENIER